MIAEQHAGTLAYRPGEEPGATFRLELPPALATVAAA
jgi:signal transduction histidine kinase